MAQVNWLRVSHGLIVAPQRACCPPRSGGVIASGKGVVGSTVGRMDLVNEHFTTAMPWVTGHLQTIRDRVVNPGYDRGSAGTEGTLMVDLRDGTGDRLVLTVASPKAASGQPGGRPVVLLVHGLGGTVDSHYIRAAALGMLQAGFPVAMVDLRGSGASVAHCRYMYHGGRTADLVAVIRALDAPDGVALVGYSLGGNAVLKLLGEGHDDLGIVAGVAVSAPLDLAAAITHLQEMAFGLYSKFLLAKLRADTAHPGLDLTEEDRRAIRAAGSLAEFDTAITARKNGWADAAQYYRVNSSAQFLPGIKVPALLIHAVDDPMVPIGSYEALDWVGLSRKAPVRRAITRHGGHVGFHEHAVALPWHVGRTVAHIREVAS